jgi:competence protein ComEC
MEHKAQHEKQEEKVKQHKSKGGMLHRLAALVLAAALALSTTACSMGGGFPDLGDLGLVVTAAPSSSSSGSSSSNNSGSSGSTSGGNSGGTTGDNVSEDAAFSMKFIDVGQALSVLVTCDGVSMLYDGGNVADGSTVVSYLQKQGVEELEYVFCSHAHEDHVGGLAAALAKFKANHVYAPVTTASTTCFKNFVKYANQQGLEIEVPTAGTTWSLGSATVRLLGPVNSYSDTNNTSLVLRIDYGSTSFLLTGDMEQTAEDDLVNSGADLDVDVLQVGHHGSETSSGYVFLRAVMPEVGIISVGAGNSYGHPHESALSRLRDAGVDVYRTDLLGDIVILSDGKNYTIASERTATDAELNPTVTEKTSNSDSTTAAYIGNKNSKTFHLPTCKNLPSEKNQVLFSSYDQAVNEGYKPCSNCIK